jgi:hypothetical protein
MARVLGIPSRVAVGYRVGTQDPQTGEFVVTGRDAHAWAELYLGGTWVRFDPTPSGAPAADATNDAALAADAPGSTAGAPTAPTTTVAAAAPDPSATAPVDTAMDDATSSADGSASGVPLGLVVALAGAVATLLVLPVVVDVHRRQRLHRRARHDPRALIMWWWHDALRWLRIAGADVRRSETPIEIATRAGPAITSASPDIAVLAQLVTAACYSPDDPSPADVETASAETASIKRDAKNQLGRTWWLRTYVDQVKGMVAQSGSTSSSVAHATSNS